MPRLDAQGRHRPVDGGAQAVLEGARDPRAQEVTVVVHAVRLRLGRRRREARAFARLWADLVSHEQ
ncbi:hypothetical protein GCM10009756_21480 [Pseudokineococcus marinus]